MAQLVKCLPCKLEDMSLIPRSQVKKKNPLVLCGAEGEEMGADLELASRISSQNDKVQVSVRNCVSKLRWKD